MPTWVGN